MVIGVGDAVKSYVPLFGTDWWEQFPAAVRAKSKRPRRSGRYGEVNTCEGYFTGV